MLAFLPGPQRRRRDVRQTHARLPGHEPWPPPRVDSEVHVRNARARVGGRRGRALVLVVREPERWAHSTPRADENALSRVGDQPRHRARAVSASEAALVHRYQRARTLRGGVRVLQLRFPFKQRGMVTVRHDCALGFRLTTVRHPSPSALPSPPLSQRILSLPHHSHRRSRTCVVSASPPP